jgi:hypothetical protein
MADDKMLVATIHSDENTATPNNYTMRLLQLQELDAKTVMDISKESNWGRRHVDTAHSECNAAFWSFEDFIQVKSNRLRCTLDAYTQQRRRLQR